MKSDEEEHIIISREKLIAQYVERRERILNFEC